MSKLEGVKIIDAKDGIIEKIAYDGAEYVSGRVSESPMKDGDIITPVSGFPLLTKGAFYRVTRVDNRIFLVMDKGDLRMLHINEKSRVFRKVEAFHVGNIVVVTGTDYSNNEPGEIGKIVDALGGNYALDITGKPLRENWSLKKNIRHATPAEIAEYEKAVAPKVEIKVGDFVKYLGEHGALDLTVGKVYEVIHVNRDGCVTIIDDAGDVNCIPPVYYEKAERERPYEVGDIVRVIGDSCGYKVGTIGEVRQTFEDDTVLVGAIYGEERQSFYEDHVELVAPASARKDSN